MKWLYCLFFISSLAYALCEDIDNSQEKQSCAITAYQEADIELNKIYKSIRKELNYSQKQKLKQAQIAWLTFRDANCAHQASESNEDYLIIKNLCLAKTTQLRNKELQNIYAYLFIGYTPLEFGSIENGLSEQDLIGQWLSKTETYNVMLKFQLIDNKAIFSSTLNGQAFESGSWQLNNGQLTITNELGELLYLYNQVTLKDNILTLYEKEGGIEEYLRAE